MRSNRTRKTIYWAVAATLIATAGCGDDADGDAETSEESSVTTSAASESAYCDEARRWAVHELEPVDDSDPAAFRSYWEEWTAFQEAAVDTAPDELRDDWELKFGMESELLTPVLEKYDFDVAAMMESATPEEQAAFEAPPEVQAAHGRILAYESEVCGAQLPPPAEVSFAGEEPGPYCELIGAQERRAAEALASGEPVKVEAMFDEIEETAAAVTEAAPEAITDDVRDLLAWTTGPQREAAERHGFDFGAVILEGTPQERADLNYADADIREQFARVSAYEEQVCGG